MGSLNEQNCHYGLSRKHIILYRNVLCTERNVEKGTIEQYCIHSLIDINLWQFKNSVCQCVIKTLK